MAAAKFLKTCRLLAQISNQATNVFRYEGLQGSTCIWKRGLNNSREYYPYLRKLYLERIKAGPEPEKHPSDLGSWNYDAELYAFGKRYGEEFVDKVLRRAFITSEYLEIERDNRKKLGIDASVPLNIEDNTELAQKGEQVASRYIKAYLRHTYPMMFEEGIQAIHDFLMSDVTLYEVASNFGLKDLIMAPDYPPEDQMYVATFKAIIGAVAESQNIERAGLFVRDFILPKLIGKNVFELWDIVNPMGLLSSVLATQGRGPPEARLLWKSASSTMMAVYHVGIYSDKKLVGRSPGETVAIAEEMAARDALWNLMNVTISSAPLQFGEKSENWDLDFDRKNQSVNDLLNLSQISQAEQASTS